MGAISGDDYDLTFDGDQVDAAIAAAQSAAAVSGILKCDGSGTFSAYGLDTTPTANSTNLVTSGGVRTAITGAKNSVKPYIIKTTSIAGSVFLNARYSYEDGIPVYADHVVSLGSGKTITYRMQLTGAHKGTSVDELYFGGVIETQGTGIRTISICGITLNSREWGEFYMYPAQPLT